MSMFPANVNGTNLKVCVNDEEFYQDYHEYQARVAVGDCASLL